VRPVDGELDLVGNVLSTGRTSRLYRRLVHEMQIAQDVQAAQDSMQLGSTFEIAVTARPGHTPEEILHVVDEELDRLRNTPPDAPETERARTDVLTSMVFDLERVMSRADRLNRYNQYTGNPDYLSRDLARYQTPTPADIQTAVRTYLPADRRVVVMVYPTPGAPIAGRIRGASSPAPQHGGAQ
jgi:zinc protease